MHPEHADDARGYELAIAEARRALDAQDATIKGQRDRAVTLLGFGGLAATFLTGVAAAKGGHPTGWAWAAAVVFVVQAVVTVLVLWPRNMAPGFSGKDIVGVVDGDDATYPAIARGIAFYLSEEYDKNTEARRVLTGLSTTCLGCFVLILAALVLDLLVR